MLFQVSLTLFYIIGKFHDEHELFKNASIVNRKNSANLISDGVYS